MPSSVSTAFQVQRLQKLRLTEYQQADRVSANRTLEEFGILVLGHRPGPLHSRWINYCRRSLSKLVELLLRIQRGATAADRVTASWTVEHFGIPVWALAQVHCAPGSATEADQVSANRTLEDFGILAWASVRVLCIPGGATAAVCRTLEALQRRCR